jgi:glucose-1-phosphate cytidylyltransferase
MQIVILAGGLGTRLSEETSLRPKPMVEIGGKPILWHIMKIYSSYGYKDFIICLGYKWYMIKEWFYNYVLHNSDITIDIWAWWKMTVHNSNIDDWKITLIDTWTETLTWWRVKRIERYITDDEFMLTYWDWVSDINIKELVDFHHSHGRMATISAVQPEGRFGRLGLEDEKIIQFAEKKDNNDSWINGWFMVLNKKVLEFIDGDSTVFEKAPLETIAQLGELMAFKHHWFWFAMDSLKNKQDLEILWNSLHAPWKIW